MEEVINKLDYNGLVPIWNVTFPGWSIEDYVVTLSYDNQDDILEDIRSLLIDEIKNNERKRQKENEEFVESLMAMDPQPMIKPNKQPRRRKQIPDSLAQAIKEQHKRRQKRITELRELYDNIYPENTYVENNDESFYEWLRNKDAPADDDRINTFLDSIQINSVIDFQKLNRNDRDKVFERMKSKFEQVFGTLGIANMYMIHYRINGRWKSRTLTSEIWHQLMETLDSKEFIYGKESFDSGLMSFSNESEEGLFKIVHFDAISIVPLIDTGDKRKDNRSSFFKYFNRTVNCSFIDLSRYQIFVKQ